MSLPNGLLTLQQEQEQDQDQDRYRKQDPSQHLLNLKRRETSYSSFHKIRCLNSV